MLITMATTKNKVPWNTSNKRCGSPLWKKIIKLQKMLKNVKM